MMVKNRDISSVISFQVDGHYPGAKASMASMLTVCLVARKESATMTGLKTINTQ